MRHVTDKAYIETQVAQPAGLAPGTHCLSEVQAVWFGVEGKKLREAKACHGPYKLDQGAPWLYLNSTPVVPQGPR